MATLPQLAPNEPATRTTSHRRKHTREEMLAIFRDFRAAVQEHNPDNRDILAEFLAERRAEAASE